MACGLHKSQVTRPTHGGGIDFKSIHGHGVSCQFVVKGKAWPVVTQKAHLSGNWQISRRSLLSGFCPVPACAQAQGRWQGQPQGLGHVARGLVVHVLVHERQAPKVKRVVALVGGIL